MKKVMFLQILAFALWVGAIIVSIILTDMGAVSPMGNV